MHARHVYVLSDQHLVETGCTIEEEQPGVPGGRLAKVQAEGSASDEEEEWYDAPEEVEAVPCKLAAAGGSRTMSMRLMLRPTC